MTRVEETETWLSMLFQPTDIFEVRTKDHGGTGAVQTWLNVLDRGHHFATVMCPIHEENKRHIWVGVCPRERKNSAAPSVARVLWCDLNESIVSDEQVADAVKQSGLPDPTMIVNSGHGFHLYWKLSEAVLANDVKQYSRGVHQALPTDATHDPTRVMRVPGTMNWKKLDDPRPCTIVEYHPERTYPISIFPRVEVSENPHATPAPPKAMTPLSDADRELFVTNWMPGHRHELALGVAGYLRKNLYYDQGSCEREIAALSEAAGYPMDGNLRQVVRDTYARPFGLVSGLSKLADLGVFPDVKESFSFKFTKPPKRSINIIDFTQEQEPQQFWVDGLIGPGLLTLWAAEPKVGKSVSVMQIGHALSNGLPLWDFQTDGQRHSVLYFQGELSQGMVYQRARDLFGLQAVRNPRMFAMTARPDEPIDLVTNPEALTDLTDPFDVVIVDPISVFNTNDETRSHSVNEVLSVFDQLRAQGKAIILVHHTRKLQSNRDGTTVTPSMNDIRGSSVWFAAADAIALQYNVGENHNTKVKFEFRAAPHREPLTLYRLPNGGFTADKDFYQQSLGGFRVAVADSLN